MTNHQPTPLTWKRKTAGSYEAVGETTYQGKVITVTASVYRSYNSDYNDWTWRGVVTYDNDLTYEDNDWSVDTYREAKEQIGWALHHGYTTYPGLGIVGDDCSCEVA